MSEEQSGLTRLISDVMSALGEIGVGIPVLLETLFPPIPSELVLPLAGFLSQQGRMNAVFALVLATLGSYARRRPVSRGSEAGGGACSPVAFEAPVGESG